MTLTINTNMSSLITQKNLTSATNSLNRSIERMTTGYKINSASDNAAGYSIANKWNTQISTLAVASDNIATGADLLTTAEDTYSLLTDHLQRIRDLTEQASNGTYGSASLKAIQAEIEARFDEISRIAQNAEFNGIKLMSYTNGASENTDKNTGLSDKGINIQVGLYTEANSKINLSTELFSSATISGLFNKIIADDQLDLADLLKQANGGTEVTKIDNTNTNSKLLSLACTGLQITDDGKIYLADSTNSDYLPPSVMLGFIDMALDDIANRATRIGAAQNRLISASSAVEIQSENLTSSLSTLRDCDVAKESSNYIQAQILQQASATLLATANQTPSIALNLL